MRGLKFAIVGLKAETSAQFGKDSSKHEFRLLVMNRQFQLMLCSPSLEKYFSLNIKIRIMVLVIEEPMHLHLGGNLKRGGGGEPGILA